MGWALAGMCLHPLQASGFEDLEPETVKVLNIVVWSTSVRSAGHKRHAQTLAFGDSQDYREQANRRAESNGE